MHRTSSYRSGLNYLPVKQHEKEILQHKKEILRDRELIFLFKKNVTIHTVKRQPLTEYILENYQKNQGNIAILKEV